MFHTIVVINKELKYSRNRESIGYWYRLKIQPQLVPEPQKKRNP